MISIINPELRLRQARDTAHALNIRALKKAVEAYAVTQEVPHCGVRDAGCPTNFFEVTGSDIFSTPLLASQHLGVLPVPPSSTLTGCYYAVQLFPLNEGKYVLRWCYESWTQADVNAAVSEGYDCQWQESRQVAVCYAGSEHDVPAP